jgi:hypothetical protein
MAQVVQNQNQFAQTPILAQVSMLPNPDIVSALLNPSSTAVLQAGSSVKLIASTGLGTQVVVDAVSGPTDGPVFGVIAYNLRKNLYSPGDVCEVACNLSYITLLSSAAIARGQKVTATAATTGNDPTVAAVTVPSTQYVTGVAIDPAAGAGALIRVKVQPSFNGTV